MKEIEYDTNIESEIIFESYDNEIATVDENGLVTTLKTGSTSIYVYGENCDFEVKIIVNKKKRMVIVPTQSSPWRYRRPHDKVFSHRPGI